MREDVQKTPTVTMVGAGPGDPDLITMKGIKALRNADVILYDALVSAELLELVKPTCKRVYVGKRKGKKEFSQEEINQLIVFYATRYTNIVRLKGGDPYVFGRGHEELEYAMRRGVHVEVIPGVSSALAAPASVGIPLTKRGVNESFWVITGMLSSGEMSKDIAIAAQSSATVVILMGMTHLEKIAQLFLQERSASEPVAVIQHATTPMQKTVRGTVATIAALVHEEQISSPAVIVVGAVVNESYLVDTLKVAASCEVRAASR